MLLAEALNVHLGIVAAHHYLDRWHHDETNTCLLYTSDAADERSSVDLGGRRIIKKKNKIEKKNKDSSSIQIPSEHS